MMRTILQMLGVVLAGTTLGLCINASRGDRAFRIGRDHFAARRVSNPVTATTKPDLSPLSSPSATGEADQPATAADPWHHLEEMGYQPIGHEDVLGLFQSEAYQNEQVIFVDARADAAYQAGHIAGAYQFDHYRPEQYLDTVLPACQNATKIVVYCNGGECEDSMLAAGDLIEHGVDPSSVFVYAGGVKAWRQDNLPFERGQRNSGDEVYLDE